MVEAPTHNGESSSSRIAELQYLTIVSSESPHPYSTRRKDMAKLPKQYDNQPELVNAITEARSQMDTGDTPSAIEWLTQHQGSGQQPEPLNVQYIAMYPEGHSRVRTLHGRRAYRAASAKGYVSWYFGDELSQSGYNTLWTTPETSWEPTFGLSQMPHSHGKHSWDNFQIWWKRLFVATKHSLLLKNRDGLWTKKANCTLLVAQNAIGILGVAVCVCLAV